eukprot:TRINITY_DN113845_c0_g1_i1.p1 TRINITY_DN113845_c0_g1~~TRINITY_DN113845_c0_g1_i1.p1  ORF type:complete len:241 (+),score=28.02 TRINITY_DN113845_c0_g1_i1:57-725(+)
MACSDVRLTLVLVVGLQVVAVAMAAGTPDSMTLVASPTWDAPWFCNGLNCPQFKELKNSSFEVREYQEAYWATTLIKGMNITAARSTAFFRLFDYISGANAGNTKIEMTSPVQDVVTAGQGPFCSNDFDIGFFLPYKYQESGAHIPEPTSADVVIKKYPARKVGVLSFFGDDDEPTVLTKVSDLNQMLFNANISANTTYFTSLSYDAPYSLVQYHEVWIDLL